MGKDFEEKGLSDGEVFHLCVFTMNKSVVEFVCLKRNGRLEQHFFILFEWKPTSFQSTCRHTETACVA